MATEQVFDPTLGTSRDLFPGESVPSEQESTLQRLMREAAEEFRARYAPIVDELTPQQQEAIAAAEQRLSERKRLEYLEAIKQNPAIIIQGILKDCKPEENNIVMAMLNGLNKKVEGLGVGIASAKIPDQLKGTDKSTLAYMREFTQRNSSLSDLLTLNFYERVTVVMSDFNNQERVEIDNNREQIVFETLKKLGLVPAESLRSFADLSDAVRDSGNTLNSGKPYVERSTTGNFNTGNFNLKVANLTSNRPGLEGITASFSLDNKGLSSVIISSSPEAFSRIIDRGQYVPYQKPTEQPEAVVPEEVISNVSPQGQSNRVRRFPNLRFLNRSKGDKI